MKPITWWLLIATTMAIIGLSTADPIPAEADPADSQVTTYAANNAKPICEALNNYPTFAGVITVLAAITNSGFTDYQSGQIIALAAEQSCPQQIPLLHRFADTYNPQSLEQI